MDLRVPPPNLLLAPPQQRRPALCEVVRLLPKNQGQPTISCQPPSTSANPITTLGTSLDGLHHAAPSYQVGIRRHCCLCRHLLQDGPPHSHANHSHRTRHREDLLRPRLSPPWPPHLHCFRPRCQIYQQILAES